MTGSFDMTEMVSYNIWGAVVTTTRAFKSVSLKVDANTQRVFVSIALRWWTKYGKFKKLRDFWLKRAETRCREMVPSGWKLLIYYEVNNEGKD
jgi:hypothetical protein